MNTRSLAEERLNHPRSQTTFRSVKLLVGCYLGISVLPGTFPLWMKIEQGVCGLLLLASS